MDIERELRRGLELHKAGNLADAAQRYRDVLAAAPENVDALNLLSAVFNASGEFELAAHLALQAATLLPSFHPAWINLGNALQAMGRPGEAVEAFQRALALSPGTPEIRNNLASALNALGRHGEAADLISQLIIEVPDFPHAHNNLGNALAGLGDLDGAVWSYRTALEIAPGFADAAYNLGNALRELGRIEEAIASYRLSVALDPGNPLKLYNLGNGLSEVGRLEEAIATYREALRVVPTSTDVLNNLASALQMAGRLEEAVETFRAAVAVAPGDAELHFNLGLALIQSGAYVDGWREYEWRWRHPGTGLRPRVLSGSRWSGQDLAGRTVLLHAEQGLGDAIQFVRLASLVAARGARVVLECRPALVRLFRSVAGVDEVVASGQALPEFDFEAPLMSLPSLLGITLETVPARVPYVSAPAGEAVPAVLADALGFKVGIVWGGSPTRRNDVLRSCDVRLFERLLDLSGVSFFSLQADERRWELRLLEQPDRVTDVADSLLDFAATAAVMETLDLVISVDTAAAHLAGALARPVWTLVPFSPPFMLSPHEETTPWYPTMRVFRQPEWRDWESVFDRVRLELARVVSQGMV